MHKLLMLIPLALCLLGASLPGCGQSEKPRTADQPVIKRLHMARGTARTCLSPPQLQVRHGGCQIKGGAFIHQTPRVWPRQQSV